MKKIKIPFDWMSFTTNFVGVCLGIIITFAGEAYITSKNEEKEVMKSLEFVRNELEENIQSLEISADFMKLSADASKFLVKYEGHYADAPRDSMYKYCNVPLSQVIPSVSHNALELMKSTGNFTKMQDMELALDIITAYKVADGENELVQDYETKKANYLNEGMNEECKRILASDTVTAVGLWTAITRENEGKQFIRELQRLQMYHNPKPSIDFMKKTVEEIDNYIGKTHH